MPLAPSPSRPLPRTRAPLVLASLVALAATAGCGRSGNADADPAKVAPQGSALYVVATVRPEGDQKDAVDQIGRKVFKVSDPGKRLQGLLDKAFKQDRDTRNVTYADDIGPWLGRRVAVALTQLGPGNLTQGAAIFAAKDTGKAQELLDREAKDSTPQWKKRSYRGVDYWVDPGDSTGQAVVGDYVVVGPQAAFKLVVDASKGKGLADKPQFEQVAGRAKDKLAFGYVDPRALVAGLSASGLPPGTLQALLPTGDQPATFSLDANPDRITLDTVAHGKPGASPATTTPLLPRLPGDSWLALGVPQVGQSLRRVTAQLSGGAGEAILGGIRQAVKARTGLDLDRDIFASLGDVAFFARGSSILTIGAGMVVQTPDPAAARRLVSKLQPLLARIGAGGSLRVAGATVAGARGFKLSSSRLPGAVNVVVKGDRLVVAYSDAATREALSTSQPLADSPDYRAAQQSLDGAPPALFVSFTPIAALVGTQSSPNAQQARTYLSAFKTLAAGGKREGDTQTGRFVVTLK